MMCTTVAHDGRLVSRTPALEPEDARWFVERGFVEMQSLVVLQRHCHPDTADDERITAYTWRRLSSRRHVALRDTVLEIDVAAFAPPWNLSNDAFARACTATNDHIILVDHSSDTDVCGFAIVGRSATTAYLQRLAVRPTVRRHGVATRLVRQASAWAESRGAETLLVNTEPTNQAALALYSGLGFVTLPHRLAVLQRSVTEPR